MRKCSVILLVWALSACSGSELPERLPGSTRTPTVGTAPAVVGATGGTAAPERNDNPEPGVLAPSAGAPATLPGAQPGVCEVVHLNASQSTPDMLIVLDRSGSMGVEGRWMPSANAVRSIVNGLQAQIRFGLAMFPDPAAGGSGSTGVQVNASSCLGASDPVACLGNLLADAGVKVSSGSAGSNCAPGKIVVPVGLHSAAAIGSALDMTTPNGGTPTPETLQRVIEEFASPQDQLDMLPAAKFVLLITDGQPTCPNGNGAATTQPDIDATNLAIETLTARGVRTYVIGYNTSGPGNEAVAGVLDGLAKRGGTGDQQHRPVENEQSLLAEFQRIAGIAVSCTFVLDKAPPRADYVRVQVDGKQVNLNDPNGWRLTDARTVELRGTACSNLQSLGSHLVDAEVQCEVVAPQ